MKEDKRQSRTWAVTLGGAANAPCPKCDHRVAFFKQGDFISETKTVAFDTVVVLQCPTHGDFSVRAGDFQNTENKHQTP